MQKLLIIGFVLGSITVASFSCEQARIEEDLAIQHGAVLEAAPSDNALVDIMRGLETDLAEVAHGLWTQERQTVKSAAMRIAEHPKVTPDQLAAIKEELGSEMGSFAQFDGIVHDTSIELADAVDAEMGIQELFEIYHRIEVGCISCHATFQTRVSDMLAAAKSGS